MVHLYNGILHSRKKEGDPILCDNMDGTREHYVKWNNPGNERQIPYDLTYKQNLIDKTNKQAKYKERDIEVKKQTDSNQRRGQEG